MRCREKPLNRLSVFFSLSFYKTVNEKMSSHQAITEPHMVSDLSFVSMVLLHVTTPCFL